MSLGNASPFQFPRIWCKQQSDRQSLLTIKGLGDKVLFSKYDIHEGYNNIQIVPEDWWKAAFKTPEGSFEPNVMLFGLQGAPGTFSQMIAVDIAPMYHKFPQNRFKHYMDDCLITMGEGELQLHRKMNHRLLDLFEQHSYFLKPSKCVFEQPEVDFLGVRLGHGEITIDPSKIAGISEWPSILKNTKEVRSTLGILRFQWPFIPGFASIAWPLTSLLKKGVTLLWTDKCMQALEHLKKIITSELVLVPPDQDWQFILEVDASQFTTGAILYQADKKMADQKGNPILQPCGYHSQTFSTTEQQYPIYDREFLAVIWGLKHWDYLLKCVKHLVLVITDHANLTYYRHPHKIRQRVAGYIAEYEQYDIQLAYQPGVSNWADALSRWPDYAPDPYNDEPVIALLEHLSVLPNTPVIQLQTCPFQARTLCLDATGITNNDEDNLRTDNKFIQINNIQDKNLNTDIETDVIHLQGHRPK
jgi:RNase H-like domain found in reverse transcriptase/Reverse transcriptase (RNA-dependent DNA polymerase)